jgi:hypothetical protein
MKGLQRYPHNDRQKVIEEMIPLIQKKFGENLIALAASASYARNEDTDYSDLELTAFVKSLPEGQRRGGMGKIREGMLVELVWTTKENYLEDLQEVTEHWYIAASDRLLPLINPEFIEELNSYQIENLKEKCLARAANHWYEVQESTAKVLNAILASNRDGIPLLAFDMVRHMLIVLSFLNQIPYVTFARFIAQARTFPVKPVAFETLLDILVQGTYQNLPRLEEVVTAVFAQFEIIFEELGVELYDDNVDPN